MRENKEIEVGKKKILFYNTKAQLCHVRECAQFIAGKNLTDCTHIKKN